MIFRMDSEDMVVGAVPRLSDQHPESTLTSTQNGSKTSTGRGQYYLVRHSQRGEVCHGS